ncbi:MAG: phosphonate ABC transporter ATP-binding protein [Syntrophomonadaceae bacterium]|nr:phosphonate ABC transporter ATP-binding protein [Syntrophomonadaceae bacterium]
MDNTVIEKPNIIEAKKLTKIYPNDVRALADFNLTVTAGEFVAILGSNGSGKTTLLRCLNGLVPPTCGEIIINQRSLTGNNQNELRQIRKMTGTIFQEANLIEELSVLMNVLVGRLPHLSLLRGITFQFKDTDKEIAYHALKKVGLADKLYEPPGNLSGGQKQKVAIARALAQQPMIFLADEPTASLDPRSSNEIMELLTEISQENGITILCVLHRVEFAEMYAKRIIGIKGGKNAVDQNTNKINKDDLIKLYGTDDS